MSTFMKNNVFASIMYMLLIFTHKSRYVLRINLAMCKTMSFVSFKESGISLKVRLRRYFPNGGHSAIQPKLEIL